MDAGDGGDGGAALVAGFTAWAANRDLPTPEHASLAEYTQVLIRVAGTLPVLPRHVDEALRRAEERKWPPARMAELARVGADLITFSRLPVPVPVPVPVAAPVPVSAPVPVPVPAMPAGNPGPLIHSWADGAPPGARLILLLPYGFALGFAIFALSVLSENEFGPGLVLLAFAAAGAWAGVWLQRQLRATAADRDELYDDGVLRCVRGQISALRLGDIVAVHLRRTLHLKWIGPNTRSEWLTLVGHDGVKLELANDRARRVRDHVLARIGPRLLAEARAQLAAGRADHGAVSVTRSGLVPDGDGARERAWSTIDRIAFDDGDLILVGHDGQRQRVCTIGGIANFDAFLTLVADDLGVLVDLAGS